MFVFYALRTRGVLFVWSTPRTMRNSAYDNQINSSFMRKKLLFLAVTLAMCGTPLLSSCSKDDEPKSEVVETPSVVGTKWKFHDDFMGTIVLMLRADGSFETNVIGDTDWWFHGYYMQDGQTVRFNLQGNDYMPVTFYLGTLSEDGMTLTVPIYTKPWDELFYTVEFVRVNG